MRPSLINEVRLDGVQRVGAVVGAGWVVTDRGGRTVTLLDHDLTSMRRVTLPLVAPRLTVSATSEVMAVGDRDERVVLDSAGNVGWRRPWRQFGVDAADDDVPFHVDVGGILWVRVAATRQLVALAAATGVEIDRATLAGPDAAWFLPRSADGWTGLGLLHPEPSLSALIGLDRGRIALRPLRGHDLAAFSPDGSRYLTLSVEGFLSVRDLATESVLAERHLDDLPDLPSRIRFDDWSIEYPALFLTDEIVLVALSAQEYSDDEHLLLSARSLRCRSRTDYPTTRWPGSIVAERHGRWLTYEPEEGTLRLWSQVSAQSGSGRVEGRLDDEPLPGQAALF